MARWCRRRRRLLVLVLAAAAVTTQLVAPGNEPSPAASRAVIASLHQHQHQQLATAPTQQGPPAPQLPLGKHDNQARRPAAALAAGLACKKHGKGDSHGTLVSGSTLTFLDPDMTPTGSCRMNERGEPTCTGHSGAAYVHKCVPSERVLSQSGLAWIVPAIDLQKCPTVSSPVEREQWAGAKLRQLCSQSEAFCSVAPELVGAELAGAAIDETVILLHPPLHLVGVSIVMERGCQQNDSLVDG